MGLTQVSSKGIKDATLLNEDVNASANIAGSKLADNSISLAKLLHGDSNNNGKFLRANNGADPTFETVNTDLVSDTSPQLGGTLDLNGNQINGGDSNGTSTNMIMLGASNDLKIYHDGSNSYIKEDGTGGLYQQTNGNGIFLQKTDGENMANFVSGGAVELYHAGGKKLETNSTGSTLFCTGNGNNEGPKIEGSSSMPAILNFQADAGAANADKCRFYGHQNGGSLLLQDFSAGSFQNMAKFNYGGNVELYNNNVKKWETTNDGSTQYGNLTIPDNDAKIILKDGNNYIQFLNTDKEFKFMNAWGAGEFTFYPGGTERVRINPNGLLFNGDTSSNNALDDYEIGDWTPQVWRNGGSNEITLGSGNRFGRYIKIGDLLWVSFYWYNPSLTTSGGQYYVVRNLPFNLMTSSTGAYQFIGGGYLYFAGSGSGDYAQGGQYRWQANGTFAANTLTLYSDPNNTNVSGALEFSGCGVLRCA